VRAPRVGDAREGPLIEEVAVAAACAALGAPIKYASYGAIVARLRALAADAPDLVELYTAQERYGVPAPGSEDADTCFRRSYAGDVYSAESCVPCRDADGEEAPCEHVFITITNRTSGALKAPSASPAARDRPQVFLSGNLHGDEWVGPATLLELAEFLVAGATARGALVNVYSRHDRVLRLGMGVRALTDVGLLHAPAGARCVTGVDGLINLDASAELRHAHAFGHSVKEHLAKILCGSSVLAALLAGDAPPREYDAA
jgi:hypothetical protein